MSVSNSRTFEKTQNQTQGDEFPPLLNKRKANLNDRQYFAPQLTDLIIPLTITNPQATQMVDRKILGPKVRVRRVAGG